ASRPSSERTTWPDTWGRSSVRNWGEKSVRRHHDVATSCELPIVGPAPCLNMVLATRDGHVLHQFPYTEQLLLRSPEGWASVAPDWRPAPAPQPGSELVPPIQAAVNFSFTPIELDHPDPFGVTVVLMEEDGYRISLTEAFAR
ncbi:hypothetical protein ACWD0D_32210, partial [Streptomyces griseoincarnatus]